MTGGAALGDFRSTASLQRLRAAGRGGHGQNPRDAGGIAAAPSTQTEGQESGKQAQGYPGQLATDTVLHFRKTLGFPHSFQAQNVYFSSFSSIQFLGVFSAADFVSVQGMGYTTGSSDINGQIQCKPKEHGSENIFSMFAHEAYRRESRKPKQIKGTCYREQKSLTAVGISPEQKTLRNRL